VVSAAKPEYLRNSSEVNARSVVLRRQVVPVQRFVGLASGDELPEEAAIGQHLHGERSDDGREGNGRPNQEVASLHVSQDTARTLPKRAEAKAPPSAQRPVP
jgi:hypothetical protein